MYYLVTAKVSKVFNRRIDAVTYAEEQETITVCIDIEQVKKAAARRIGEAVMDYIALFGIEEALELLNADEEN